MGRKTAMPSSSAARQSIPADGVSNSACKHFGRQIADRNARKQGEALPAAEFYPKFHPAWSRTLPFLDPTLPLWLIPFNIAEPSVQHVAQNTLSEPAVQGYRRCTANTSDPCNFAHYRCISLYPHILYDKNPQNGCSCCCRQCGDARSQKGAKSFFLEKGSGLTTYPIIPRPASETPSSSLKRRLSNTGSNKRSSKSMPPLLQLQPMLNPWILPRRP